MGSRVSTGREKNEESAGYVVYKAYPLGSSTEARHAPSDSWIAAYAARFIFLANSESSSSKVPEGLDHWLVNRQEIRHFT